MADRFQLRALITGVDRLSPTLSGIRRRVAGFRNQMERSGLGRIGFSDLIQGGVFAAPFIAGTRAAIEFESKMADVRKVVDFKTPEQFDQMGRDILEMSKNMPVAAGGIAEIVAAGGQAGIARKELKAFARDAVQMGIAFDQTASESGDQMAKWRTSFKLTQEGVTGLADQINYLSNNGAATAKQISAIVTSIGPLGAVAGLAAGQIAAMGSTLAGMGVGQEIAATGIKNLMLTLTAGASATKAQSQAFKSLRLDAKEVAQGMQTDAQGTITKILETVGRVDKDKRAAVLTQLFGKESVGAIAPLLTNLDQLKTNFAAVGDSSAFGGSMLKEYEARSKTTSNAIQLMKNRVTALGISVGSILLPPLNDALATFGPIVSGLASMASANPWLIKGLLGAAAGFAALRVGVMVSTTAMKIFGAVTSATPIGLIVRAIALSAGLIIANWGVIGPWVSSLWDQISGVFSVGWGYIKTVLGFTPLGMVVENWGVIAPWLAGLWDQIKGVFGGGWDYIKAGLGFTPMGMIVKNWEPIVGFFRSMWERIKPYIEPLLSAGSWVGDKVSGLFGGADDSAPALNRAPPSLRLVPGTGPLAFPGAEPAAQRPALGGPAAAGLGLVPGSGAGDLVRPRSGSSSPASGSASLAGQTAAVAASRTQLDGGVVVRFENAPPGLRVESTSSNQPNVSITPRVGYRALSGG